RRPAREAEPSLSSGWRRRPGRRAREALSSLARFGSYRCAAWLLLAQAASDPVETFGVDSVGRRTDLDKCRLDGVEHRVRAAGKELESLIAHRQVTGEDVRVQVTRFSRPIRRRLLEHMHHFQIEPGGQLVDAVAEDDAVPRAIAGEQDDRTHIATVGEGLEHAQGGRDPDATSDQAEAGAFILVD